MALDATCDKNKGFSDVLVLDIFAVPRRATLVPPEYTLTSIMRMDPTALCCIRTLDAHSYRGR